MSTLTEPADITMFAKSPWSPTIRREHAWAHEAAQRGWSVRYLERPLHVRNGGFPALLGGRPVRATPVPNIETIRTATVVPGHRARWAESMETTILRRAAGGPHPTAVINLPWHWAASVGADRRVLDLADDWVRLHPHRADRIWQLYKRIADEADDIVVTDAALGELFPGRHVTVVPNGASRDLLDRDPGPAPGSRRMAYVGTVTERVDHALLAGVLDALPDWSLDLIGPFSFAGRGSEPDEVFGAFRKRYGQRVRCHGPVPREHLGPWLDAVDVLLIPNRTDLSHGQSSMKLFDYAAHGRAIVSTIPMPAEDPCPHVHVSNTAESFAAAIVAPDQPRQMAERRAWAERNTWSARAQEWLSAVSGAPVRTQGGPS